jgi:hypothetical protein
MATKRAVPGQRNLDAVCSGYADSGISPVLANAEAQHSDS